MPENRTIILTGATRGLGAAMTEGFIAAGHTVLGCGRDQRLIDGLTRHYAKPHDFQAVNVADWNDVKRWAERLLQQHGAPDLLINNAAAMARPAPLWEISDEEFATVMGVNVNGIANTIRAFLPAMIKAGKGIIVNFSSGWGRSTSPEVAPYCASKWAVEGLTQALAQELPSGLAAIPLNPGVINTDMLQKCLGSSANSYAAADEWARKAVPYILNLRSQQNGISITVG
jgi:NAD(P)-dependent dehydrogenase (short-subunit alcohol dehydrogenase family)